MNCPICNNEKVEIKTEVRNREFRNEAFKVFEQYFYCDNCKNDFTNTEQDEFAINQVYNQYREKYDIPFPEELTELKEKYGVSSAKMAEILGFGINQFRNYELGEIPNNSNSKTLKIIKETKLFRVYVEQSKNSLKEKDYNKIISAIDKLEKEKQAISVLKVILKNNLTPSKFNGYKIFSFEKFCNMLLFFNENAFFQVRLNKFLFYADFYNYKRTGKSISGLPYAALQMGPVPDHYKALMDFAEKEDYIEYQYDESVSIDTERIVKRNKMNYDLFDEKEIETMNRVSDLLRFKKTDEIKEMSHNEIGWIENYPNKSLISYLDYAPLLKEYY